MNKPILFIIDSSALKEFFEGKNSGDELTKKLKKMDELGNKQIVTTTMSAFFRAVWLCEPEMNINRIQKVLGILSIAPSFADFKDENAVRLELMNFAKIMSGRAVKNNGK
jgi:hypothetical protein